VKSGRPAPNRPAHSNTVTLADDPSILSDWSVRMRERRRRQYMRLAEQAMPMTRYYQHHGGPLLAVPIGHYYVSGRWAA
jgi:hypothetical protein